MTVCGWKDNVIMELEEKMARIMWTGFISLRRKA